MQEQTEFRCDHLMHGVLGADGRFEVKCRSNKCGARSGVVVLHYFDVSTGRLLETKKFRDADQFTKERTA